MFTVFDQKAETFMPPFFVPAKGLAIRAFEDCINSDSHHFGQHPADYTLFYLGEFNTDVGHFELLDTKQSIGNGVEFVNPLKSEPPNVPDPSRSTDQNS
nr:MAG: nonstructural protein [Microvirus sp.]